MGEETLTNIQTSQATILGLTTNYLESLKNLSKGFSKLNNKGNDPKQGTEPIKGKKLNTNRKRKDKDGLGIKYTRLYISWAPTVAASITSKPDT